MTNIHVWTPHRYNFTGFQEALQIHPFFQNNKIRVVHIHYWPELTFDHIYDIFTTSLLEHGQKSVNIFLFDDDELEDGCGREVLETTIRHFINITKLHPSTYFLFADFIDFLYTDATYSPAELTRFKQFVIEQVNLYPTRNFYKDFHGYIDGKDCDCYNRPTEAGMKKLFEVFSTVLRLRTPAGAF